MGRAQGKSAGTPLRRGVATDAFSDVLGDRRGSGREDGKGTFEDIPIAERVHLFVTHCAFTANTSTGGLPKEYLTMGTTDYPTLSTLAYAEEQCSALGLKHLRDEAKGKLSKALRDDGEEDIEIMDIRERAFINLNCAAVALIAAPNITEREFAELTAPARKVLGDIELLDREAVLAEASNNE